MKQKISPLVKVVLVAEIALMPFAILYGVKVFEWLSAVSFILMNVSMITFLALLLYEIAVRNIYKNLGVYKVVLERTTLRKIGYVIMILLFTGYILSLMPEEGNLPFATVPIILMPLLFNIIGTTVYISDKAIYLYLRIISNDSIKTVNVELNKYGVPYTVIILESGERIKIHLEKEKASFLMTELAHYTEVKQ